jgi:hypothetical protein
MKDKENNRTNKDKSKQFSVRTHYGDKKLVDCMRAVILTTSCK